MIGVRQRQTTKCTTKLAAVQCGSTASRVLAERVKKTGGREASTKRRRRTFPLIARLAPSGASIDEGTLRDASIDPRHTRIGRESAMQQVQPGDHRAGPPDTLRLTRSLHLRETRATVER